MTASPKTSRVCVAAIAGAHGVRGLVRVKCFTATPEAVASYGPVSDETGERSFRIVLKGAAKGVLLAQLSGIDTREQAEALKGTRLYVARERLPDVDDEDDFYHADLIGLRVEDTGGATIGRVAAVHDFGAGPLLDIRYDAPGVKSALAPFTREVVPEVDLENGRLVVALPPGLSDEAAGDDGETTPAARAAGR